MNSTIHEKSGDLVSISLPNAPGQVAPLVRRLVSNGVVIRDTWTMGFGSRKIYYVVPQQGRDADLAQQILSYFEYEFAIEPLYGRHIVPDASELVNWLNDIRQANMTITALTSIPNDLAHTAICLCLTEMYRDDAQKIVKLEYPLEDFSDPLATVFAISLPHAPSLSKLMIPMAERDVVFRSIALGSFEQGRQLYLVPHEEDDRQNVLEALNLASINLPDMNWEELPILRVVSAHRTPIITALIAQIE